MDGYSNFSVCVQGARMLFPIICIGVLLVGNRDQPGVQVQIMLLLCQPCCSKSVNKSVAGANNFDPWPSKFLVLPKLA